MAGQSYTFIHDNKTEWMQEVVVMCESESQESNWVQWSVPFREAVCWWHGLHTLPLLYLLSLQCWELELMVNMGQVSEGEVEKTDREDSGHDGITVNHHFG